MDWLLTALLTLTLDAKPAPMTSALGRANARTSGLATLRGKRVMMFGDSMVNCGINVWLKPWFKRHGVSSYRTLSWASSTIPTWTYTGKLRSYLWRYDPDIVIVVLGTNEMFLRYPRMRIRSIKAMLKQIGPRRAVYWIGPPSWKSKRGLIDVIHDQLPKGHFFDTAKIALPRRRDGYHPNPRGARLWSQAIIRWYRRGLVAKTKPAAAKPARRLVRNQPLVPTKLTRARPKALRASTRPARPSRRPSPGPQRPIRTPRPPRDGGPHAGTGPALPR